MGKTKLGVESFGGSISGHFESGIE